MTTDRAVLIATLGTEAQVVTLTLDALRLAGHHIDVVAVIHTSGSPIRSALARLQQAFDGQRPYLELHPLYGVDGMMEDVVTGEDIDEATQTLHRLMRRYKDTGYTIHLSIAGGRKTMALFALIAAQVVFGPNDQVWHLVSAPELVRSRQLHADHPDQVTLVPVPTAYWGRMSPEESSRAHRFIHHEITDAEREVVELLISEGLTNREIAVRLGRSPHTIKNQLTSVYEKLNTFYALKSPGNRAQLLTLLGRSS